MISIEIPIRTGQGLNGRLHWAARARKVKGERFAVKAVWPRGRVMKLPVVVRLTRVSPSTRPMDDDNLHGALKAIRDQVAAQLEVDDGDVSAVRFEYAQARGPWAVRIEVEEVKTARATRKATGTGGR